MKSLDLFKLPGILVSLAAVLVLTPASKAQSEIAPDHFDGTDSWEAAAHHKVAGSKSQQERVATQANHHTLGSRASLQLITKRKPGRSQHPSYSGQAQSGRAEFKKNNSASVTIGNDPS
jgi:hypothetical protein